MSFANEALIKNLESQLERLVEQMKDLEEMKHEISEEEFSMMKEETAEQIKEFSNTLDRMHKGDVTLNTKFSLMKSSIRTATAASFNTVEMIKMFGAQDANELEQKLLKLDEEFRLKKMDQSVFETKKIEILAQLQSQGRQISIQDQEFLERTRDNIMNCMEQIDEN